MKLLMRSLTSLISVGLTVGLIVIAVLSLYMHFNLPNVDQLNNISLQTPMRIYTADHKLIAKFGEKRRIPITYADIPKPLIQAVLATEDQRFFEHDGVDFLGLIRASVSVIISGRKSQGGSTITMQVARNYFLTRRKTYTRKLNEILLAIKIDQAFSKEKILELYFNKIFFGNRAYGIAAAAHVYYGKTLDQLTLAQMAMLAGIPKAPSTLNPLSHQQRALKRRNHVLARMLEEKYIDQATYDKTIHIPLTAKYHGQTTAVQAPYVAEMIRKDMLNRYHNTTYTGGYQVTTTIDSHLQDAANQAVQHAILNYDKRHGFRGPLSHLTAPFTDNPTLWLDALASVPKVPPLHRAAIMTVDPQSVTAVLADASHITIPWQGLRWARLKMRDNRLGSRPKKAADILSVGDVVYVQATTDGKWQLSQKPKIEGALVALNPDDGAILALVGGFSYHLSHFNRATQSERQPGSNIKPFLYAAALAHGMTLATLVNDAPIVVDDPSEEQTWRPQNASKQFHGPTRLRVGLIKSRNLVSIRILENITLNFARHYIKKFGFALSQLPNALSLALGSGTVSPLTLANAYAVLANGGHRVNTYVINQITQADNQPLFKAEPERVLPLSAIATDNAIPAPQVISPDIAFLITSAMQDVIKKGTGRRARSLKRSDLAGKTGTTNDQMDAWFSGFNRDLVAVTWMGFDEPKTLHEYAAQAALPMWIDFMKIALANQPNHSISEPANIVSVRIDPNTGLLAPPQQHGTIFEYFRKSEIPKANESAWYAKESESSHEKDDALAKTPSTTHEDQQLF